MNNEISAKNTELKAVEERIINSPELKDLSSKQLEEIAKLVLVQRYANQMNKEVELSRYDYKELKSIFLESAGRTNSVNTKLAYENALNHFEKYLSERKIENPLDIDTATADDFIYALRNSGKSASTVRQFVGAVSSYFSFVERRSSGTIKNVFRGTKARPQPKTNKSGKFYNISVDANTITAVDNDINTILNSIENKEFKSIILIMVNCGLRVGAFNSNFKILGNKFICQTKGKEFIGVLPEVCLKAIRNAGLSHSKPFENWCDVKTKNMFKYYTKKLFEAGNIQYPYSCHDIRHLFSIRSYNADHDIHKLSKLLGHSSIAVTEKYLKGLNVIA